MKVGDLIRVPDALDKPGAYGLVVYEPYSDSFDVIPEGWEIAIEQPAHQLVGILFMDGTIGTMEFQDVELVSRV